MQISASDYAEYNNTVQAAEKAASDKMIQFLQNLDFGDTYESKVEARNKIITFIQALVPEYGDAAATAAANWYNKLAEQAGVPVADAILAESVPDEALEKSVRYNAKHLFNEESALVSEDAFIVGMTAAVKRYVGAQASKTISKNAVRDKKKGVKFARIPSGNETCAFCIMLASRGFVYATKETAGDFDHYHKNCDCRIVAGFGENPSVEGYDEQKYKDIYNDAKDASNYYGAWADWLKLPPEEQAKYGGTTRSGRRKEPFNDYTMKRVTKSIRDRNSDING